LKNPLGGYIRSAILIVLGCLFGVQLLVEIAYTTFLPTQTIEAEVINKSESGRPGNWHYYVSYSYNFDGQPFRGSDEVGSAEYVSVDIGNKIQITVSTLRPDLSQIHIQSSIWTFLLIATGLTLSIFLPLFWLGSFYLSSRKFKRLKNDATLLIGKIYKRSVHMSKGNMYFNLEYEFTSPSGRVLKGSSHAKRNDLTETAQKIPVGQPVAILYAGDRAHTVL
jgi:hypothetical protein